MDGFPVLVSGRLGTELPLASAVKDTLQLSQRETRAGWLKSVEKLDKGNGYNNCQGQKKNGKEKRLFGGASKEKRKLRKIYQVELGFYSDWRIMGPKWEQWAESV